MKRGKVLIVSGSAGSGKSTVLTPFKGGAVEPFRFSVSATTRAPREGEVDGRDYFFVDNKTFDEMVRSGELIEHTVFNHHGYGTPRTPLEKMLTQGKVVILEIEVDGAEQIMHLFDEKDIVSVFLTPPDYETLEKRLRGRGTNTEDDIRDRLERAKEELTYARLYQHILINSDGRAADVTDAIIALATGMGKPDPTLVCPSFDALCRRFYQ